MQYLDLKCDIEIVALKPLAISVFILRVSLLRTLPVALYISVAILLVIEF